MDPPFRIAYRRGAAASSVGSKSSLKSGQEGQRSTLEGGRCVRTRTENAGESLVPARQRPQQFPLRPYTSNVFEGETRWLGIELSHSFVAEPQCNGVAERFMRTVKEERLWLFDFEDLEQARARIAAEGTLLSSYRGDTFMELRHEKSSRLTGPQAFLTIHRSSAQPASRRKAVVFYIPQ
jgi:transposase InsO family protein